MTIPPDLRALLACPQCHGELNDGDAVLDCPACGLRFPVQDDIPVLLLDAAVPYAVGAPTEDA